MTALRKIDCIKLKKCPSKSGNDYQRVLKNKVSVPARYLLDNLTSVSTTALKKVWRVAKKFCKTSGFIVRSSKLVIKKPLCEKTFFSKTSSGNVEWSAISTTLPKNAHQNSGNFPIEVVKKYKISFFNCIFSAKVFAGIARALLLALPKFVWICPTVFLSNSVVNYIIFLKN